MSTSLANGMPRLWISRISSLSISIRNGNGDFSVKTSRSPQCRVKSIGNIRRRYYDEALPPGQSIHQCQELSHHSLLDVTNDLFALRSNRINLIEENDAGPFFRRFSENLAKMRLALPVELVNHFRTAHRKEICLRLIGNRASDEGLAAARRTMKKNSFGSLDPQALENLRIP